MDIFLSLPSGSDENQVRMFRAPIRRPGYEENAGV
jgi:hypothetical protein